VVNSVFANLYIRPALRAKPMNAHSPEIFEIPYGGTMLSVRSSPQLAIDRVGRRVGDGADQERLLATALESPIAAPTFSEFLYDAQAPIVVVNDATRSTPTDQMLEPLLPYLNGCPDWRVVVATGLHRAPTESELEGIFGASWPVVRGRLIIHDGRDSATHRTFPTAVGEIALDRALTEADRIIILTSVEPHFFAGYTGGRKSIIPGLAGTETVRASHAGAVKSSARPLVVEGNPVRTFIEKGTEFVPSERIWALQVVLDRDDQVVAAFAGDIDKTFAVACDAARNHYVATITEPYDIVLSVVHPPLDLNLYQAQKGWELSQSGVRAEGVLIVVSPCTEGVGSSFYTELITRHPDIGQWERLAGERYRMGEHKLVRTARARRRFRLGLVTRMPVDEVKQYGYESFSDLHTALAWATQRVGAPARMLIVDDAGLTTVICDQ
jgi:nickel-dependent lactate racemase